MGAKRPVTIELHDPGGTGGRFAPRSVTRREGTENLGFHRMLACKFHDVIDVTFKGRAI